MSERLDKVGDFPDKAIRQSARRLAEDCSLLFSLALLVDRKSRDNRKLTRRISILADNHSNSVNDTNFGLNAGIFGAD